MRLASTDVIFRGLNVRFCGTTTPTTPKVQQKYSKFRPIKDNISTRHSSLDDSILRPCPGGTIYCKLFRRVYQSWNYNLARDQGADHSIALVIRYLAWFLAHLFPLSGRRIGSLALGVLCGSPVWRGGSFPGVVDCWPHCNLKSCLKRTVQSECEKHAHTASALPPGKCVCMCSYTVCVFVNLYAWIVSQYAVSKFREGPDTVIRPHRLIVIYTLICIQKAEQAAIVITIKKTPV